MNFKILKKIIIIGIVAGALASAITAFVTKWNYQNYVRENNKAILTMVEILLEEEDISKGDIVSQIQNAEDIDWELLKGYGYTLEMEFFLDNNEANLSINIITNIAVVNGYILLGLIGLYIYLYQREEKIEELIAYLQQLQEKNYGLKIEGNEEAELSKLQNEIYKITIQLKEQAEQSVLDKEHVKNNIVDISHQLKTPLTSMLIMTDNMLEYPDMDEETKHIFLENIRGRISHMEGLVQSLLKLSRFDANVIEFKKDKIQVDQLIENVVQKNQVLLEEKNIKIHIACPEDIEFTGDFRWQSEALSNILKNAIEHSPEGERVEITGNANNFVTKIQIKDYGNGIKKESIKKIFTRYYKDENSSETSIGVGLNLAKAIVEKDQGVIKVTSRENVYTTFEIRYMK